MIRSLNQVGRQCDAQDLGRVWGPDRSLGALGRVVAIDAELVEWEPFPGWLAKLPHDECCEASTRSVDVHPATDTPVDSPTASSMRRTDVEPERAESGDRGPGGLQVRQ